jgi:hypothetical protein
VELQLSIGANPNEQDAKGLSPLMVATVAGATELMSLLLAAKADVQAADPMYCMTALHVASNAGRDHAVRLLLEHAADVSALTKSEETALHRAARRGHLPCVQALLRAGCDPLVKTRQGTSALTLADEYHSNATGYTERKHASAVVGLLLSPQAVEVPAAQRKLRGSMPEVAESVSAPSTAARPRRPASANDATKSSPRSGKQLQPSESAGLEVRAAKLEVTRLLRKLQQSQAALRKHEQASRVKHAADKRTAVATAVEASTEKLKVEHRAELLRRERQLLAANGAMPVLNTMQRSQVRFESLSVTFWFSFPFYKNPVVLVCRTR